MLGTCHDVRDFEGGQVKERAVILLKLYGQTTGPSGHERVTLDHKMWEYMGIIGICTIIVMHG